MKIIFPKADECLLCRKCKTPIGPQGSGFSDDGAVEDYWCDVCIDYVDVKAVKAPNTCSSCKTRLPGDRRVCNACIQAAVEKVVRARKVTPIGDGN